MPSSPLRKTRGFTLVELLVVIGIIALLISILLPTLGAARESANAVACASNMRSAGQAMVIYTTEQDGWLAGPNTSGQFWARSTDAIGPGESSADTVPLQNMDWMSPTLGLTLELPENDADRLRQLYESNLRCPTNDAFFTSIALNNEGLDFGSDLLYGSYAAVIQFHAFPQREATSNIAPEISDPDGTGYSYRGAVAPADYAPKITKVGGATEKAYLIEGARYIDPSNLTLGGTSYSVAGISFNAARFQIQGGNFMARGPYAYYENQPHYLPTTGSSSFNLSSDVVPEASAQLAWRHGEAMNLAFFDGHVEKLSARESVEPDLYFPSGTTILDANFTYTTEDEGSYVIN